MSQYTKVNPFVAKQLIAAERSEQMAKTFYLSVVSQVYAPLAAASLMGMEDETTVEELTQALAEDAHVASVAAKVLLQSLGIIKPAPAEQQAEETTEFEDEQPSTIIMP